MKVILLFFLILCNPLLYGQSFEKSLIDLCITKKVKNLEEGLKIIEKADNVNYDELINYEIIDNFQAQLFEIKTTIITAKNQSEILTYHLNIIKKDTEILYYEIEKGSYNSDEIWTIKRLIIKNCGGSLFKDLSKKYTAIYNIHIEPAQIFNTDILYYRPKKRSTFNCSFHKHRAVFVTLIEKQDTIQLLNWLKSSNIPSQLYAIEGIFELTEKGVIFPPNTWKWIEIVQQKEGVILLASGCEAEKFPIDILVREIKGKHKKAKRIIRRNRRN